MLALAAGEPRLARPIVDGFPDLLAEAVQAVRVEQARGIADVLFRRTRLALLAGGELVRDSASLRELTAVLGDELGWDGARRAAETERFLAEAAAEGLASAPASAVRAA